MDNCILEDGMVYVQNPGSIAMTFCTFRHATVILQHVNASIIQNCEFSQTDSAAITVEGYPKEDRNWTFRSLNNKIMSVCTLQRKPERRKSRELKIPKSAFSLSTATVHKKSGPKSYDFLRRMSGDTDAIHRRLSQDIGSHDIEGHSCNMSVQSRGINLEGAFGGAEIPPLLRQRLPQSASGSHNSRESGSVSDNDADIDAVIQAGIHARVQKHARHARKSFSIGRTSLSDEKGKNELERNSEKYKRIESFVSDCAKYSNPGTSGESTIGEGDGDDLSIPQINEGSKILEDGSILKQFLGSNQVNVDNKDNSESDSEPDIENNRVTVPALELHTLKSPYVNNPEHDGNGVHVGAASRERSLSSSEVSLHTASSNDVSEEDGYNSSG